jgi:hypothetical protein
MNILVNVGVQSVLVNVIRCDIKPRSVERSRDLDKEGVPQQFCYYPTANKNRETS